jgi:hypothetical protein
MTNSNRFGLGMNSDLTIPSAVQGPYPLGFEVSIDNSASGSTVLNTYKYIKSVGSLTAGGAYVILPSNTAGSEWITQTPATSAVSKEFGFAEVAFTAGYYGFLLVEGKITNAVSAGATTAGNTCSLANGVTTVTDEAGTTETAKTVGVLATTAGGAGTVSVIVKRKQVTI